MVELAVSLVFLVVAIAFAVISYRRFRESERLLIAARRMSDEAKERSNIVISNFFKDRPEPEVTELPVSKAMQLPPHMVDTDDIIHLPVGTTAYTLPWAMMVDEDMRVWINGRYPITFKPFGTSSMLIQRTEGGVRIVSGMEKQTPSRGIPWVGAEAADLLPVVDVPSHARSR